MIFDIILVLKGKKIDVHITQVGNAVGCTYAWRRETNTVLVYMYIYIIDSIT